MHNTSTEYKQMHNKTISWNDNWILIFICFVGRLLHLASSPSSFITTSFLIQMLKMDKRFFKNWILHIPHHLRDLLSMVRAWSSIAPIFFFSSYESTESNHFLLAHIPQMNESHDLGRPFKVVITIYYSSLISSS